MIQKIIIMFLILAWNMTYASQIQMKVSLSQAVLISGQSQKLYQPQGHDYLPNSRTLDQHISKLRKRIEIDPKQPSIIRTVHGVGYQYA